MRHLVVVSVTASDLDLLTEALNRLICTPVMKDIYVLDVTENGFSNDIKALIRSYHKFNVFYSKISRNGFASKGIDFRINSGVASAIKRFQVTQKPKGESKYQTLTHVRHNMLFEEMDLQVLINNAQLFNALSPTIESIDGVEIFKSIFNRWGVEYVNVDGCSLTHHITNPIEESYALNPKCFSISSRYLKKCKSINVSDDEPVRFLNSIVFQAASSRPQIDAYTFIHEHLY